MAAFYRARLKEFLKDSPAEIVGQLSLGNQHNEIQKRQINAWRSEINVLMATGGDLIQLLPESANWTLLYEYTIPRRQKRLDAVILADDIVFCLEFKTEDKAHSLQPQRQVEDYALDLRDFHKETNARRIVPIVVIPKAGSVNNPIDDDSVDSVRKVRLANADDLAQILVQSYKTEHRANSIPINPESWESSAYHPVPTIIEAAELLYAGHKVSEIAHSHAGTINLTLTSNRIVEIIQHAKRFSEKVICIVTGVPGAGKTLAGLSVVHNPVLRQEDVPTCVFLSGNGPLVKIVSAAIARDHKSRLKNSDGARTVGTSIQNVHVFVREGEAKSDKPPIENVVVFDEAQRAWNAEQNLKKIGVDLSEPETIFSIMERHQDWAVIVALVGGGQEINTGEAGLAEWGKTLREKFAKWKVYVSPKALDRDASNAGHRLFADGNHGSLVIQEEPSLHLAINVRSFRADKIAQCVDAALAGDAANAAAIFPELKDMPFTLTRSLNSAKQWLHKQARGQQRAGLVASSGAIRLRADGLELSSGFRQGNRDMYVNWFLNHPPDIRSSNQLEIAASEYECQGLELDWVGVCWGADYFYDSSVGTWKYRNFSGSSWKQLKASIDRQYLLNTYRVLLTRARRGMIIWIPKGEISDGTRDPRFFDSTADFLVRCGVPISA